MSAITMVGILSIVAPTTNAQSTCAAADNNSVHFIYSLGKMMGVNDGATRARLQLPVVAPSQITLVSDSPTCARAGFAADSIVTVWVPGSTPIPTTAPLYVIKIGTSYAVADLNSPSTSEFDWVFIFGPLWEYRGALRM